MPAPERTRWFTVTARRRKGPGGEAVLYSGQDEGAALSSQENAQALVPSVYAGVTTRRSWKYPPPEACGLCKCKGRVDRQMACAFGHPTLCHWPQECGQAGCGRPPDGDNPSLLGTEAGGRTALWLSLGVQPADLVFSDAPAPGEPGCHCSRCGRPVGAGEEPVRLLMPGGGERRYHPACLGLPTPADLEEG